MTECAYSVTRVFRAAGPGFARPGRAPFKWARLLQLPSLAADSAGDSLAAALDRAAIAFDGFGHSLDDARTSSTHASQLLKDASATRAQRFGRNTDELRGVSEDVSTMSEAIDRNARDVAAASKDGPRVEPALRVLRL